MTNNELKEWIELHSKGIKAEVKARNDVLEFKLDKVIEHQKLTNGRIGVLESETRIVRFFSKYPKMAILVVLGFVFLFNINEILDIINKFF